VVNGNSGKNAANESSYVATVRELVRVLLPRGYPSVARTAGALKVSVRTFQRRLHTAGISYSDLVEGVRLETARRLLEESNMPLQDIATALGYSEPSSLSRLIARKTGKTPRAHRREHRKRR
jgi:AraC-like DNA-binding protein